MKRYLIAILFTAVLPSLHAQELRSIGRERTGTEIIPYSSAADRAASPYFQSLAGEWKVKMLDDTSQFTRAISDAGGWTSITLPGEARTAAPVVLFQRQYKLPFAWVDRLVMIHLQGIGDPYDIYVGDKKIGSNSSPQTGADFDVTKISMEGNNTLTLVVYAGGGAMSPGASSRPVKLQGNIYALSPPRIRIRDIAADATSGGILNLGVVLKSHLLNPKEYEVYYELYDPDGRQVTAGHKPAVFRMKQEDTVRFFANIPDVRPWSADEPNLYTLRLKTQYEGRYGEYVSLRIGFRDVTAQGGKLLVNGNPVTLRSVQVTPVGDLAVMAATLKEAKAGGANTVQLDGYPAGTDFYSLCDMIGLYVCDQAQVDARYGMANDPAYEGLVADRVMTMYEASKNHPSVVMFSLAQGQKNGYNLYRAYIELKRREKGRPVSFTGAAGEWNSDTAAAGSFGRIVFGGVAEVKTVQPFTFTMDGANATVSNRMEVAPIKQLEYRVVSGKKTVAQGSAEADIAPQGSATVALPLGKLKLTSKHRVELSLPTAGTFMGAGGPLDKMVPAPVPLWYGVCSDKIQ